MNENYIEFINMALEGALSIVEGKWDRERDWEVYIMTGQNIRMALELMKDVEADNGK